MTRQMYVALVVLGLSVIATSGCRFGFDVAPSEGAGDAGGQPGGDGAASDAARNGCWDWTPVHVDPCVYGESGPELVLRMQGEYLYDTIGGALLDPLGENVTHTSLVDDGYRIIHVDRFEVGGSAVVKASGGLPLVVVSPGEVFVAGTISVASERGAPEGAGSQPTACDEQDIPPEVGQNDNDGAAGGGGGGYRGAGGRGGDGDANGGVSEGGDRGSALEMPDRIAGGCRGAAGGNGYAGVGALGGAGGGAIELISQTEVLVSGIINAGGAGGWGGLDGDNGGGGGGSGGYIGLDARRLTFENATIAANGGGGGGGSGEGEDGGDGGDGEAGDMAAAAGASTSGNVGTAGGAGSAGAQLEGQPAASPPGNGAAGGGGGGAGFILFHSGAVEANGTNRISPPDMDM